jgi:hypothetical protein
MSCLKDSEIKESSLEHLLQCYLNARKTWYGAGGHTKANMNKYYSELYLAEIIKRDGQSQLDELLKQKDSKGDTIGSFNGVGSW